MTHPQTIPRFAVPYGAGDYWAALRAAFRQSAPSPAGVARLLGAKWAYWTSSGRQALWLILRALRLPREARVAVPLYCDGSVHTAIREAGCEPFFVDIDEKTLTIEPTSLAKARERVAAVVVVHYFGHVARMDRLLEIARGLPVIEDTAHAPLSYHGGRMTGSFGVASFYSFASTKYWPAGGGGLAVINDQETAERVRREVAALAPTGPWEELKKATGQAAKSLLFRRPVYGLLGRPIRPSAERRRLLEPLLDGKAIQRNQAAVALRQAAVFRERVERQRHNSLHLLARLAGVSGVVLPVERAGVRYNYYLFPVLLADSAERDAVAAGMLRRHVDTSRIHYDVVERARMLGYRGGCPVSEAAAARMLTLPNYACLSPADIDRVATVFLDALESHRCCVSSALAVPGAERRVKQGALVP